MTMKDGICPNCQSKKVYHRRDNNPNNAVIIGSGIGSFQPEIFVCTNCGNMMQFVHESNFKTLENNWTNVFRAIANRKIMNEYNEELKRKPKRKNNEYNEKFKRKPKRKNDEL